MSRLVKPLGELQKDTLRVGLLGTGEWAQMAHIPAFQTCRNARIVVICGHDPEHNEEVAKRFGIPQTSTDYRELMERNDIDVIDIATSAPRHFSLALAAIEAGKAVLCEKPLTTDYKEARLLYEKAAAKGVKTKVGFTLRYSPVVRRMKELIEEGFVGVPYHFNGFLQNSQFVDTKTPFRWNPSDDVKTIMPGSLEEYAPHLVDIALWMMGELRAVVGHLRNFVPERFIRDAEKVMPINIEDGCICIGEFQNGAQATFQSSFIAIGNYPGLEIRVYGSKGALIGRLVEESGVHETLSGARPDKIEFVPLAIPERLYPSGPWKDEPWEQLHFRNLVQSFVDEILNNREPEGNFRDGAKTQEVCTAIYLSHVEKRWIRLPLS
jgi:predicted dehydrogenase